MQFWQGKTVLVTGATGSFGRAVIPELLGRGVARLILFSRDELKQGEILAAYPSGRMDGFLGDVRDRERLRWAMRAHVDVVIHAAALKQVPSCQCNCSEAIATNVTGSENVMYAAIEANVAHVMALSTDKACAPLNAYGKTKALMEEIVTWSNARVGRDGRTKLSCVRYGNVIGSRGSVIPLWRAQARCGDVVTITDPAMTRFWMTLDAAVALVLSSIELQQGGEVFVPKLGACRIDALAAAVAPQARVAISGRRPGEKQHEVMVCAEEADRARDLGDRFAIYPDAPSWPLVRAGVRVPEGFTYTSADATTLDPAVVAA